MLAKKCGRRCRAARARFVPYGSLLYVLAKLHQDRCDLLARRAALRVEIGLAAVDVPDRHGHRLASAAAAGAAEQQRKGEQQRGDTRAVVHPGTSLQGVFFSIANFFRPGNQNRHIFYTCLDTGGASRRYPDGGAERR